jgi:hypothetical protein
MNSLEKEVGKLDMRVSSLESAMISGFGELSKFAGITFEEFQKVPYSWNERGWRNT